MNKLTHISLMNKDPWEITGDNQLEFNFNESIQCQSTQITPGGLNRTEKLLDREETRHFLSSLVECLAKSKRYPLKPCSNYFCFKKDCPVHQDNIGG